MILFLIKILTFNIILMSQQTGILVSQSLSEIYPGIAGQLQNRHTSLYSLIHMSFSKVYQDTPEVYICVNRSLNILQVENTNIRISMGCQNGIILAVSRTFKDSSIFVNGKGLENQLEFTCKGKSKIDCETQLGKIIEKAIQIGIQDCSTKNLYGGIIYFQSQLPESDKISLTLAFTLAVILINDLQNDYTLQEIQKKVSIAYNVSLNKNKYVAQRMLLENKKELKEIPFQFSNVKFMVGDLLMTQCQVSKIQKVNKRLELEMDFLQSVICQHLEVEKMSLNQVVDHLGCTFDVFKQICLGHIKQYYNLQQCQKVLQKDLAQHPQFSPLNRLILFLSQMEEVQQFVLTPNQETLNSIFSKRIEYKRSLGLVSPRIQNIIASCLNEYGSSCSIIQDKYLLVVTNQQKLMWLFEIFKKLVYLNPQGQLLVQGNIQHLLFSTGPSAGIGVLDLSGEMWY